jgi:Heparinase II/III N-terminus/Heparinase II/III-like protein
MLLRPFVLAGIREKNTLQYDASVHRQVELSLQNLCQTYPQRIRRLFRNLNLNREGLENVQVAAREQNWVAACKLLVDYYQHHKLSLKPGVLDSTYFYYVCEKFSCISPEHILKNSFTFQQASSQVPRCLDGRLDWAWRGHHHDDEWAWFLNRHYYLLKLLAAYQETNDLIYIYCLNHHLLDWITSSFSKPDQSWAQWRGREVSLRVLHWATLFYSLPLTDEITPSVRILMLSSLLDHTSYLLNLHHWGGNWICREMSGLATVALCWQEFKQSSEWLSYATERLINELDYQVYPDGVHKELTSHYHRIVLQDFQNVATLLELMGNPVPPLLNTRIEQMVDYLAYSTNPEGQSVQNNDSDQDDNCFLIQQAAISYKRPDWMYIASQGKIGEEPNRHRSIGFPWAGQVVSRSGWDQKAHWSFFDFGPLGINYHVHHDKLHISVASGGRRLLVDSGRYSYRRDHFWNYFRQSASHNIILIDGAGQGADYIEQTYPLTHHYELTPTFDFAWGRFTGCFRGLKGRATHTRAIIYLQNKYWVVVDLIESDRPRTIQPLWHFHPACAVKVNHESVVSTDPDVGNLRIIPVSNFPWQVHLVAGQTDPVQGWWSREYNHIEPNPTAVYTATIGTSAIFAWVLFPGIGVVPHIDIQILSINSNSIWIAISEPSQQVREIVVCLDDKDPVTMLSNGLKLQGKCAILNDGQLPLVAMGKLFDAQGNVVADSHQALSH